MIRKAFLCAAMSLSLAAMAQQFPYQNPQLSAQERADDLLSRLTIEEKTLLMMDNSRPIERLGVGQFHWWNEALHGVGRNGVATVFPITMGMAASFDDALVHQVFTAVSDEARAKNTVARRSGQVKRYQGLSFWTPNINIFRDPRWGRGQETYGEDPFLTGRMGLAVVRGLQGVGYEGQDLGISPYRKLLACAKHFAVHSGPEWNRHSFNLEDLPERDLWETYLPAFKTLVVEGKVAEIMCAYQRIDGKPCCGNHRFEHQILRDEWGFQGLITSDCGAIDDFFVPGRHDYSKDGTEAVGQAVRAGTDVECGGAYRRLPEAVRRGDVTEAEMDRSLRRLLVARFELGDFDDDELVAWTQIPYSVVASEAHKQLALDVARKSIVLLKNDGVLPLRKEQASQIVVMGPNANDSIMQWGNYNGFPTHTTTILGSLRSKLGQRLRYVPGCGLTRPEVVTSRFSQLKQASGLPGMTVSYWDNEQLQGQPVATAIFTAPVNQSNGGATVFAPGVPLEHFSARYTGTFVADETEQLLLKAAADNRLRIIIDGDTIVDKWRGDGHQNLQEVERTFNVERGKTYQLQIDYGQIDAYAAFQFDILKRYQPSRDQLLAQVGTAQTVIFVGGISPRVEGEQMEVDEPGFRGGDRTSIELPQVQRDIVKMLSEAGKKVVFVNCSGSAVALTPEHERCAAIVQAWYGGEKGGQAVADVVCGDYNPSGRLPVTFYKDDSQLPDYEDYTMRNRTYRYFNGQPLYAFGHGLSYTSFIYSKPKYKHGQLTFTLTNSGQRDGDEVVQVYFRRIDDTTGPLKSLCAYKRVSLKAGESQTVSISLPLNKLESWDASTNTMRAVPGKYELMVGPSSADDSLKRIVVKLK